MLSMNHKYFSLNVLKATIVCLNKNVIFDIRYSSLGINIT